MTLVIRIKLRISDQIVTSVSFDIKNGNPPRNAGTLETKSVKLEVRWTTDFFGGAYLPSKTSRSYALTTLIIFRCGRTDGAETNSFHFETRGPCCAPIYTQFVAEGVVYAVGPVRPPHSAPNVNYHMLSW